MIKVNMPSNEKLVRKKKFYNENGVVQIGSFFDLDDINKLRAKAMQAFRISDEKDIQRSKTIPEAPMLMFNVPQLSEYTEALRPIVNYFLGDELRLLNQQYYFRMPGDGDQFNWHQDICFRVPKEKFSQIETGYLQTAIIVDHMDKDNGGIRFVKGSHKTLDERLVPRDGKETGLRNLNNDDEFNYYEVSECANFSPGDLILWSVMIIHSSEKNESQTHRSYFMNGFAKEECILDKTMFPVY